MHAHAHTRTRARTHTHTHTQARNPECSRICLNLGAWEGKKIRMGLWVWGHYLYSRGCPLGFDSQIPQIPWENAGGSKGIYWGTSINASVQRCLHPASVKDFKCKDTENNSESFWRHQVLDKTGPRLPSVASKQQSSLEAVSAFHILHTG